jgi:glycosyltransferase involved in cell wall biosynthesis
MMKVFGIARQDTAVGLYRILQPVQFIDRVSKEKSRVTPFTGKNMPVRLTEYKDMPTWDDKMLMENAKGADVIFSNAIFDQNEIIKILNLREWSGAKWVVDIDDDLYSVSTDNPASKNVEGIIRNFELCLSLADGVTVSVPSLKEKYKKLNPNIYVNPNGQDVKMWDSLKKPHVPRKEIRIGWRGASGHSADVSLVYPALKEIKKKYDVDFVTLGVKPPFKTEHIGWVGTLEFPQSLANLDLDIALVPLVDSPYNHAKSNIAVQEFGMLKVPVVASPVENQLNMPVSYAKSNYEWYEEIVKLIENKKHRKQQGENLYNHVKKNWSVEGFTPGLIDFFEKLPRKNHKPF